MPETIITGAQTRRKDSYAPSSTTGLVLRANGEEQVSVIDSNGVVYPASLPPPSGAPGLALGAAGNLEDTKWYAYKYVYAASRFQFVDNLSINGSLAPRSNSSPLQSLQITGGNKKVTVTVAKAETEYIDKIWIFRTEAYATQGEAELAAQANQMFFIGELADDGTAGNLNYEDNNASSGADQLESDNYAAPMFGYCVYYDPYWWGFGNPPFIASVSISNGHTGGKILLTLTDEEDKWFSARNGQVVTLAGSTATYTFEWVSPTTATLNKNEIAYTATAEQLGTTVLITIQGPATTLYRSKPYNPFAWGQTEIITEITIPKLYAFRVGGGFGTAIAIVPNQPLLVLSCEHPTKTYTLNLRAVDSPLFQTTLRAISDVHSISVHHSQFAAIQANGQAVLWGMDFKNFAILQIDGNSVQPISQAISPLLRQLSRDRVKQSLCHGIYDARTELNCMWLPSERGLSLVDLLVYQHSPSGQWGFLNDRDVLSSANVFDTFTGESKTYVGTESGFLGHAFAQGIYSNWLPSLGVFFGTLTGGTANQIEKESGDPFLDFDGLVGNWVLITDALGKQEQYARISGVVNADTLSFDRIQSATGADTTAFDPIPAEGFKFYTGLTECSLLRFFDLQEISSDKTLLELWLHQEGIDPEISDTLVRVYREFETTYTQFTLHQNTASELWFNKTTLPPQLVKFFGIEIINRGYTAWKFLSMSLKLRKQ